MPINKLPPDGGIIYTETNMAHLFPEPLNAVTSIFFLAIAVFGQLRSVGILKHILFLAYCLILLYIGALGGTIYHSFRQWPVFILMDWMPIMFLCTSAGFYFLAKSTRWYYAVLMVMGYLLLMFGLRNWFFTDNPFLFINLNYAMMASLVLFSVVKYLMYTHWRAGKWVGFALFSFVLALIFRIADQWGWFSFGTHFLWHTFGAIATFCMLNYIYVNQDKIHKT